jgi:uncharacterized protein involved in exopolysaccharide biosynthesis
VKQGSHSGELPPKPSNEPRQEPGAPAPQRSEFRVSQAVYSRLLRAYPRGHRAAYGLAMAQLFRDQCRDAWNESRSWGLGKLWLRILPDLACTSLWERLAALKERKTMTDKLANLFAFRVTPASTFFRVFVFVFLLVLILSVAVTFILPESYASTARIRVESDAPAAAGQSPDYDPYYVQTTFEIIQSQIILNPVIDKLKLNTQWGKKYYNGQTLKTSQSLDILKQRLQLAPLRNTKLIAITAYSDDKNEAAQIANAVAESYRDYRIQTRDELAAQTLQALEQKDQEQEQQIQQAQAEVDTLQQKFGILDNAARLDAAVASREKSIQETKLLLETKLQLSQLQTLSGEERRKALSSLVLSDAGLSDLQGKLRDAEQKYASLTNDYSLSNVEVTRVTSLIKVLNTQIDERVAGLIAALQAKVDATQAASDQLAVLVQKAKPSPENRPYWAAKENLDHLLEAHKLLIAKIEEQKLDAQLPKPTLAQITDTAEPGFSPVKPNKPLNIVVGALAGILLATGAGGTLALLSLLTGKRSGKPSAAV